MGAKNVARSLIMIGLILYISLALLGFMCFRFFVILSRFVCLSSKGGGLLVGGCCCCVVLGMIVWLVLCPMVIKKSFNALAISVGSVYVVFSYLIDVGDCLGVLLDGIRLFKTFACCFGFFFVC